MENIAKKVKVFIVEDEIILAEDIKYRLSKMGYEVVGIVATAIDALNFLSKNSDINIILLDISIKGHLDGIELATLIKSKYNTPFVFLTSNASITIVERAKATNPYAYILKPFNDRQISIALELALVNFKNKTQNNLIAIHKETTTKSTLQIQDSLFLKKEQRFERVPLKDILLLQADSNYCNIFTSAKKFIYSTVLKKIEEQLPTNQFLRVHRSYVVNINKVTGFEGNSLFIEDKKIPISKSHREVVFNLFNTL